MRLYEEINDKIIVTEYLPDKEKVLEFKKREIEKVPKEERLLSAERNTNWHYIKFGQDNIGLTELLYREKNLAWGYAYHKLECSKLSIKEKEKIINDYTEHVIDINYIPYSIETPYENMCDLSKEKIDNFPLIDINDKEVLKKLKYFLASDGYNILDHNKARMEGIINSTEAMYIYHMLILDKFKDITNKNIEEEVNLFLPFKKLCEFDVKELRKNDINLKSIGIVPNNSESDYDKLMTKVKESEHILKLIKK